MYRERRDPLRGGATETQRRQGARIQGTVGDPRSDCMEGAELQSRGAGVRPKSDTGKGSGGLQARTQIDDQEMKRRWDIVFSSCPICGEKGTDFATEIGVRYHKACFEGEKR